MIWQYQSYFIYLFFIIILERPARQLTTLLSTVPTHAHGHVNKPGQTQ